MPTRSGRRLSESNLGSKEGFEQPVTHSPALRHHQPLLRRPRAARGPARPRPPASGRPVSHWARLRLARPHGAPRAGGSNGGHPGLPAGAGSGPLLPLRLAPADSCGGSLPLAVGWDVVIAIDPNWDIAIDPNRHPN